MSNVIARHLRASPPGIGLVPLGPDLARRIAGDLPQEVVAADRLTPVIRDVAVAYDGLFRRTGASAPWTGYLAVEDLNGVEAFVGTCGFKDAPRGGSVEIAYFTFPDQEGRGIGRRMAAALVEIARGEDNVSEVLAHTRPMENASTRILRGLGFILTGTVEDPEDGSVWRWHLRL